MCSISKRKLVNTGKCESHIREENSEALLKKEDRITFRQSEGAMSEVKVPGTLYSRKVFNSDHKFPVLIQSFVSLFEFIFGERRQQLIYFSQCLDDCCWLGYFF